MVQAAVVADATDTAQSANSSSAETSSRDPDVGATQFAGGYSHPPPAILGFWTTMAQCPMHHPAVYHAAASSC